MSENSQNNVLRCGAGPARYYDFYGCDFLVTPDVLIPRPETEQLVDEVLTLAGKAFLPGVKAPERVLPEQPVIFDIGTGSGCIAVTLKRLVPEATVVASDVSEAAIKVAEKNAARQNTEITFIIAHLLEFVNSPNVLKPDLVVANLPYVDENWEWIDKKALSREPSSALYAEDGGLRLIKELVDECEEREISRLILEADPCQHEEIVKYAVGYKLKNTRGFILSFERR